MYFTGLGSVFCSFSADVTPQIYTLITGSVFTGCFKFTFLAHIEISCSETHVDFAQHGFSSGYSAWMILASLSYKRCYGFRVYSWGLMVQHRTRWGSSPRWASSSSFSSSCRVLWWTRHLSGRCSGPGRTCHHAGHPCHLRQVHPGCCGGPRPSGWGAVP